MSDIPDGLSPEEAALWARLAATVTPLKPRPKAAAPAPAIAHPLHPPAKVPLEQAKRLKGRVPPALPPKRPLNHSANSHANRGVHLFKPGIGPAQGLDSHWERRLSRAGTAPDFTLDLHGHTLDQAHARLDRGIAQAKAMGARLVLVITGKPRPVDAADRGSKRGAIRAKMLDWLAAGQHAGDIAAVKQAHRRHGGDGALYLILKRRR